MQFLGATALIAILCNAHNIHAEPVELHTPSVILQQVNFEASIELPMLKNGARLSPH